jgi:tryptophan-rich sensory protein
MPFGPTPSIGLLSFAIIKIAGYSLFGHELNKSFKADKPKPFVFGVIRTALGVAVGALAILVFTKTPKADLTTFLIFLVPFRFGEWTSIIWFFYRPTKTYRRTSLKMTILGILWSFALDIPVIASLLIIPGGLWIC